MKISEFIGYFLGYVVGFIITRGLILEFNPNDLMSWLFLIPIGGFDVLLTLHFIQRIRAELND